MDAVIFSCVRAPPAAGGGSGYGGGIGFLSDKRRMNVAITRAKRSLVVLGHVGRLSTNETWKALVDHAAVSGRLMRDLVVDRRHAVVEGGVSAEAFCAKLEAILAPPEEEDLGGHVGSSVRGPKSGIDAETVNRHDSGDRGRCRGQIQAGKEHDDGPSTSTSSHDSEERMPDVCRGQKEQEAGSIPRKSDVREESIVGNSAIVRDRKHPAASVKKRSLSTGLASANHSEPPENHSQLPKAKKIKRDAAAGAASGGPSGDRTRETERKSEAREERRQKRSRSVHPHGPARKASGGDDAAGTGRSARSSAASANTGNDLGSGFLDSLLGSMQSNAARIASGETHDFREGLKGTEVNDLESQKPAVVSQFCSRSVRSSVFRRMEDIKCGAIFPFS